MNITLLRHEVAMDRDEFEGASDSMRPLLKKGEKRAAKNAPKFQAHFDKVDLIIVSPYLRAQQTAQPYIEAFDQAKCIEAVWLQPGASPAQALAALNELEFEHALLVTHEPFASAFCAHLLVPDAYPFINFKKGAFCFLEGPKIAKAGEFTLNGLIPASVMKRLKSRN